MKPENVVQNDKLINLLKAPLGLSDSAIVSPLSGGAINRSYYLNDAFNEFMVKEFQGESSLRIDRQERFDLQLTLSNSGLAPKPIYLSSDTGIYVEEWIKQRRSEMLLIFDERHINSLAWALTRVHKNRVKTKPLDLPADWLQYLTALQSPSSHLVEEVTKQTQRWKMIAGSAPDDQVFCHNDLVWAHLCVPSNIILDWEYAGVGNRYFDILSCAKVNGFNTQQCDLLLTAYAMKNNISINEVNEGCLQQTRFVELTYQLWHQAVGITSKN
jgi:thiamine kinase-like enzyme